MTLSPAAVLLALAVLPAAAQKQTVCTITVNSADEREAFRRHLPADRFDFVELVERGRSDWLAASCRRGVRCDVLVVSGHFAGNEFYSSKFDVSESLPVDEMERVACGDSCPGLFSQLKEVYLFGCDSLKPDAPKSATPEIVRGLVRSGMPPPQAEALARDLSQRHGEASLHRMRRVFPGVPVIYGFSSLAPYGRVAGPMLERHFAAGPDAEVGSGRASQKLLKLFGPSSMVVTAGLREGEPHGDFRAEACRFHDDRPAPGQKLAHVHRLLGAPMTELRMSLERIERFLASVPEAARDTDFAAALQALSADAATRSHYLAITRDTIDPALRVRMLSLAARLGWLTVEEHRAEHVRMVGDLLATGAAGFGEVDLVCSLNGDRALDTLAEAARFKAVRLADSAALACLGNAEARSRVLQALASADEGDVQLAQAYLRHRPIDDEAELRRAAMGVAGMKSVPAQVRALGTLARHSIADREVLEELARLYARTRSPAVQQAIAEVFIRAGAQARSVQGLGEVLRRHRLPGGEASLVDALIRRLQSS